jgi:hypothetical protein
VAEPAHAEVKTPAGAHSDIAKNIMAAARRAYLANRPVIDFIFTTIRLALQFNARFYIPQVYIQ